MLRTLAVSGYRSLRDVVIPLEDLTVVTGPNGSGKSNLYRALRLLASAATGDLVGAVAREGGLPSLLWAGPENGGEQGTVRRNPIAVQLGFASDELGYLVDLGIPQSQDSVFARDPEIKREQIFAGPMAKPATLLIDRLRARTRVRDGAWVSLDQQLAPFESIITDLADGDTAPELLGLRRILNGWRFYDHFRVDADAPARRPQVGTRSPLLAHDGSNLAAVWATVVDAGFGHQLDQAVDEAFPGSRVRVAASDGVLRLTLRQPGLLRPLDASELSDGTLRYLLLCAALLPARPAPLTVLNEPESSLHASLLPPLANLVRSAAEQTQVLLVSHAAGLVDGLGDAHRISLVRFADGTAVEGQGRLEGPPWRWGAR
ncbi:AAA family ATPase [Microbacterium sp. EYE_5]|uniref:AAA family ATPase n=1 Tax=unclassified Microbacterium TaxID=2609290 RepID=UPI0020067799|nr:MULTISPECIES: AAA family ATPase [unclassified Microbacterium]MCK6081891.1 AAA family ATPase [Microbacterium sp. EYE_382]MCK6087161.1 AAA family ATPase [Microbacterium sp. EYE_384]MCK6124861.1 AAA family ATPase [Microbacterium sp. EYE_80]MCK6127924.1 AAA family ATPase [Microbacterium sp. EYE_79]MCK6142845.1 AAA family ATPase [Microbacterium sp. EYE_39]